MVTWLQWFTVQKFTSVYFCVYVYVGTRPVPRAPCAKIVQVPDFPEKIICKPLFLKDFLYHYQMISYHLTPQFRNRLGENKSESVSHRWSIKTTPIFSHVWHYPRFVVLAPVSFTAYTGRYPLGMCQNLWHIHLSVFVRLILLLVFEILMSLDKPD